MTSSPGLDEERKEEKENGGGETDKEGGKEGRRE